MKKMTCRQMGGMCDAELTGATPEEMMKNGKAHLVAVHPEMAASVDAMSETDPMMVAWMEKFQADYAAAPEM